MTLFWVIPCFNEANRLKASEVLQLLETKKSNHVLLVDDGSTDNTQAVLQAIVDGSDSRVKLLSLEQNVGKGEAVRQGLLAVIDLPGTEFVGYLDADFSTPPEEAARIAEQLQLADVKVAMGSRIQRLGARVERTAARHYLGRVFATVASLALGLPVYDTQCGAKMFKVSHNLRGSLQDPFVSRWAFDVELLGRLLDSGYIEADFVEIPVLDWRDVRGSSLGATAMVRAGADLLGFAARRRFGRR